MKLGLNTIPHILSDRKDNCKCFNFDNTAINYCIRSLVTTQIYTLTLNSWYSPSAKPPVNKVATRLSDSLMTFNHKYTILSCHSLKGTLGVFISLQLLCLQRKQNIAH